MDKTINDRIMCFFNFTNQYKKHNPLIKIKKETPKFKTDKIEKVLGGNSGKM